MAHATLSRAHLSFVTTVVITSRPNTALLMTNPEISQKTYTCFNKLNFVHEKFHTIYRNINILNPKIKNC
jgi:hypothetical protein